MPFRRRRADTGTTHYWHRSRRHIALPASAPRFHYRLSILLRFRPIHYSLRLAYIDDAGTV